MPTIPELPAASATTNESELAIIYKNGTTYKAVLADILALRQRANAILDSLSGLGAGVGFLQKTGPTTFVTTYIPGAGAYDPLGTAQAINDAHNIDAGAHAAAGFAKLGIAQTWTAAQRFDAGTPTVPGMSIGSTSYGFSLDGTSISMAIAGIPRVRFAGTLNTQDNYGNSTTLAIRRANGTYAAPTKVLSGESLGQYMFRGAYDVAGVGTWDSGGPYIRAVATEDYNGAGTKGAYLSFAAITTGSGSATESLRIAGDLVYAPVPLSVTGNITTRAGSAQDGIALLGRSGGTSSYLATITPPALAGNVTITLPTVTCSLAGFNIGQTWTAAQTFRAASAIRVEAAATQDAIILAGRTGGSGSYAATIVPGTLSGSVAITLPTASTILAGLGIAQTWTAAQTFRAANAVRVEAASTQDAIVLAGRAGGTNSYAATITTETLNGNRIFTLPDYGGTVVVRELAQTFSAAQRFDSRILMNGIPLGSVFPSSVVPTFLNIGSDSNSGVLATTLFSTVDAISPRWIFARSKAFTAGTYTAVGANTVLGELTFLGADGASFKDAAYIRATATAGPVGGVGGLIPTKLEISTVDSTGVSSVKFGVNTNGTVAITSRLDVRNADTQDAIYISGRAGGTSSYAVTLTPATLSANVTQTLIAGSGNIPLVVAVPATATSAGVIGQIAFDATYAYFCYAVNTWCRVAIATW